MTLETEKAIQPLYDRRIFERFSSRLPARFKNGGGTFGALVYLEDASALGLRLTTKERLSLKKNITLEVVLPKNQSPMILQGEVVWTKSKEFNVWETGVKFHKISLMQISRLYRLVTEEQAAQV